MSLNHYNAATGLIAEMENGPQYVRVTAGSKLGSVGRVMEVRSKYYSVHDYRLQVGEKRSFWMKGGDLEHLPDWKGGTRLEINNNTPIHNDLMGNQIEVGSVLLFARGNEGTKADMSMGTVRKISPKGAIWVKLFKNSQGDMPSALVRVAKPNSAMILSKHTMDQVLLAKLGAVF